MRNTFKSTTQRWVLIYYIFGLKVINIQVLVNDKKHMFTMAELIRYFK